MYKLIENIKLALKAIWAKKIRSFLTMLGVIIGVFSIVLLVGIGEGVKSEIAGRIEGLGSNVIMILPGTGVGGGPVGNAGSFSTDDYKTIKGVAGIKFVVPMAVVPLPVAITLPVAPSEAPTETALSIDEVDEGLFSRARMQITVVGSTSDVESVFIGSGLDSGETFGRLFSDDEFNNGDQVAVLQSGAVKQLFPDETAETVLGKNIYIGKEEFEVIRTQEADENASLLRDPTLTNMVIISLTAAEGLTGTTDINQFAITTIDADKVAEVQSAIHLALLEAHEGVEDFTITNQEELLEVFDQILGVLTTMLGGIAAISLLVGGIGVMNIMLVSVTERTREIGLRKAIGASGLDILIQFLVEAIFLTFLGGVIGIGLAFIGGAIMDAQFGLSAVITLRSIFLVFAFTTIIGVFFGVAPAIRAARLNPIDALKYE